MSPSTDVQETARICEEYVAKQLSKGYKLPKRADNQFESDYCPELNVSPVMGPDEPSNQSLKGVISTLSNAKTWASGGSTTYHGLPEVQHNSRLMFDPFYANIDHSNFWECDWTDFYEGAAEAIPPNPPLLQGKEVDL